MSSQQMVQTRTPFLNGALLASLTRSTGEEEGGSRPGLQRGKRKITFHPLLPSIGSISSRSSTSSSSSRRHIWTIGLQSCDRSSRVEV